MTFAPGTVLERYTVEGVLGQGGMAIVYRVRHAQLGTTHALKVLHAPNPAVRDRFLQEGRVQGQLRHPNIVPVTDLVEISGSPGLVMEFVDGPSLEALLDRYQPTLEQADALATGILEGVTHAHKHGFIHRDLKPANVLLAVTSNGLVPKVADFGLAKLVRGEGAGLGHTRSGMVMGTPSYMAPEQIRDSKNVDHRADIFSLGVILYELVSNQKPFEGADIVQLYTAITKGLYRPISEVVPGIPDRMERAIVGALAIDKNMRIQDCDKLLAIWRGDGRGRPKGAWDGAFAAAQAAMPAKFEPRPVGDVEKEITFQDDGGGPTAVPATGDHPVLADLGNIRIASPDAIGSVAMSIDSRGEGPAVGLSILRGTPTPVGGRLASIDPSGQVVDDDEVPTFRRGIAPAVAMVAVGLFGLAVIGALGSVAAGLWVFPGATTATAVQPPEEPVADEPPAEVAPDEPAPSAPVEDAAPAKAPVPAPSAPVKKPDPAPVAPPKAVPDTPVPVKVPEPAPEPEPDPDAKAKALMEGLGEDEPEPPPAPEPEVIIVLPAEPAPEPTEPAPLDTPPGNE